jgi:hypothetical protein
MDLRLVHVGHGFRAVIGGGDAVVGEVHVVDGGVVEIILQDGPAGRIEFVAQMDGPSCPGSACVHDIIGRNWLPRAREGEGGRVGAGARAHGVDEATPVAPALLCRPLAVVDVLAQERRVIAGSCQPVAHGVVHVAAGTAEGCDGRNVPVHEIAIVVREPGEQQRGARRPAHWHCRDVILLQHGAGTPFSPHVTSRRKQAGRTRRAAGQRTK